MISLKLAMAREIAQKIVDNPDKFGDLAHDGAAFIENVQNWQGYRWEERSPAWGNISKQLPEILEKLSCTENVQEQAE